MASLPANARIFSNIFIALKEWNAPVSIYHQAKVCLLHQNLHLHGFSHFVATCQQQSQPTSRNKAKSTGPLFVNTYIGKLTYWINSPYDFRQRER
jgi:hypothetical protein